MERDGRTELLELRKLALARLGPEVLEDDAVTLRFGT